VLDLLFRGANYKWVIYHMDLLIRTEQGEMRKNCLWASLECIAIKMDDGQASLYFKTHYFNGNKNKKLLLGIQKNCIIYSRRLDSIDCLSI
jgi:hypothetical protein